jgi:hypothetical protein
MYTWVVASPFAIVNNAAVYIHKWLLEFLLSLLVGTYPEVDLLGHKVIFSGNTTPFSTVTAPFYIPTKNTQVF